MLKSATLMLALLMTTQVNADVYKYVDSEGHTYYTDEPRSKLFKRIIVSAPHHPVVTSSFRGSPVSFGANKSKYNGLIETMALRHNVDAKLLHAVIQTESAYDSSAISSKGAVGLMQLMPDTAKRFGVLDSLNPEQNIDGGARYLKFLLGMFSDLDLVIAAYNAGENAVIRHNNSIPPYPETQGYVKQVLTLYRH